MSDVEGVRGGLTLKLTGAGARSAQGTGAGHENAEGMASFGVHVERTVRLMHEARFGKFTPIALSLRAGKSQVSTLSYVDGHAEPNP